MCPQCTCQTGMCLNVFQEMIVTWLPYTGHSKKDNRGKAGHNMAHSVSSIYCKWNKHIPLTRIWGANACKQNGIRKMRDNHRSSSTLPAFHCCCAALEGSFFPIGLPSVSHLTYACQRLNEWWASTCPSSCWLHILVSAFTWSKIYISTL